MNDSCDNVYTFIIHDPLATANNEKIFLQDFPKIWSICFIFLENAEEMSQYYMHSDVCNRIKSLLTQ